MDNIPTLTTSGQPVPSELREAIAATLAPEAPPNEPGEPAPTENNLPDTAGSIKSLYESEVTKLPVDRDAVPKFRLEPQGSPLHLNARNFPSVFPPDVLFIGSGNSQARYRAWLEKAYAKAIAFPWSTEETPATAEEGSMTVDNYDKTSKLLSEALRNDQARQDDLAFLQALAYVAVFFFDHEVPVVVMHPAVQVVKHHGHRSGVKMPFGAKHYLGFAATLASFVTEHEKVLFELAPYLGLTSKRAQRAAINRRIKEAIWERAKAEAPDEAPEAAEVK